VRRAAITELLRPWAIRKYGFFVTEYDREVWRGKVYAANRIVRADGRHAEADEAVLNMWVAMKQLHAMEQDMRLSEHNEQKAA
jgi:hypothetical protein